MTSPKTQYIDVAGRKIQLTVGGKGPPLLYLHSAGGETEWLPFQAQLAESHTLYVPAHPGFMNSDGLETISDIHDLAWHYVDLLAQLSLPQVPMVGFSLGAWLGLELAILRPELVSRLHLTAAAGLHVDGAPMGELFIDDLDRLKALLFHRPDDPAAKLALPSGPDDPNMLFFLRNREATARLGWNPYLHDPKLRHHLHRIQCPVKLLWGQHDRLIPVRHGAEFARLIPVAHLRVLENSGHMVPFEAPDDYVADVLDFLG